MQAGQEAVEEAQKVAQGNQVTAMKMDLADLATVKQFVTEFLSKFSRLDVLVNNAGVMGCPFETTKDGYEKQLQTNHIGGFVT
jgi:NAD(P)-dependent dehydrogenase (short-subunit alcohol dehydrogenase family)